MNTPVHNLRPRRQSMLPNVIFVLIVANGLMYAAQHQLGMSFTRALALWSFNSPGFEPWQLVTHAFLHHPQLLQHILFNMFLLWMFGRDVEHVMGEKRFALYYLVCIVGAGITQLTFSALTGQRIIGMGASGGVFGVMLAYGMLFPNRTVQMIFPPIAMRAWTMVLVFGVVELFLGVTGLAPGVGNFAHLGGMLFGFMLLKFWQKRHRR